MTLDTLTLRVAFAVAALTLLLLFYFNSYRRTRAPYSGWWCTALALFLAGALAYLPDGTVHQVWANPLGNILLVAGCASVWSGARSLRTATLPLWGLAAAPAFAGAASVLDSPATNAWCGGAVFLALMGTFIGLSSRELFLLDRSFPASTVRWRRQAVSSRSTTSAVGRPSWWTGRTVRYFRPFLAQQPPPSSPWRCWWLPLSPRRS